ncbi:hypothetical protein [Streptomyces sp. NPDC048611]|uniref:hypothetical protein n=1 Tax=Streptomyces sp. NPDC048611 TaxID=3155635 RepID=UPI0034499FB5
MLSLMVAHDHDRVRALTKKPDHRTGCWTSVDQITDGDQHVVRTTRPGTAPPLFAFFAGKAASGRDDIRETPSTESSPRTTSLTDPTA